MSAVLPAGEPFVQPYPGLRPFLADEAHLYFGREKHRTELLRRLAATRFVAVVGTSGSGKSSLVQAGLLPDLLSGYLPGAGSDWVIVTSKPGDDPLGRLASAFSREGWKTQAGELRTNSSATLDLAGRYLSEDQHLLVLVDQFEELFRLKTSQDPLRDADEKAAFVRLLLTAGGQRTDGPSHARVHVLVAMRSEFLGRASVFRGLPEAIDQGQYLIPRLTREQLRRAIECPARVAGGDVDDRLLQQLLNELGDDQDYLPVLQHALMRCWEFRDSQNRIGTDAYKASGEFAGALSMDATGALDDVRCALADRGALIVQRVFQALRETDINGGQTRRPTTVADLCEMADCTSTELTTALDPFRTRSFVLPPITSPLEPSTLLDISHEALLRGWDRLTKWIEEDDLERQRYVRIATRAADELGSEHPDYLAPPVLPVLVKFWRDRNPPRAWAIRHHPGYEAAKAFLEESERHQRAIAEEQADERARAAEAQDRAAHQKQALADEVAKRKHVKRISIVTITVASLVIAIVFNGYRFARRQAGILQEQRTRLAALLIAAKVPTVPDANLSVRLQLAAEATRRLGSTDAQKELLRALMMTPIPLDAGRLAALGPPRAISSVALSPSDGWLFAVAGNRLRGIEMASGLVRLDVPVSAGNSSESAIDWLEPQIRASDEHVIVFYNGTMQITNRRAGTTRRLSLPAVSAFTISTDGRKAAFLASNMVLLCDLSTECQKPVRHVIRVKSPRDVALSADGATLAVTGDQLALFDTNPWKQRKVREMASDPDATELAVSVDPGQVHVCTTRSLQQFDAYDDSLDLWTVREFPSTARVCGFSTRGAFASHDDGTIRVWDVAGGLVSLVSAPLESTVGVALGSQTLVVLATEQHQMWQVTPYGRLETGEVLGFARGGAYAYGADTSAQGAPPEGLQLVELDSGALTPGPKLPKRAGPAARFSDSLALAAYYRTTRGTDQQEIALVVLQPDGASAERWKYNLDALTPRRSAAPIERRLLRQRQTPDVTISPDDRYVAIHAEGSTAILDAGTGRVVRTLAGKSVFLFMPGDEVLAAAQPGVVAISLKDGSERRLPELQLSSDVQVLGGHQVTAAIGGDGGRLAVAQMLGQTSVVYVFAWPDLRVVARLPHTAGIISLSFRADAENLIVSTGDGTTHVWDLPTGREVSTIPPARYGTSEGTTAVFTPRGQIAIYDGVGVTVLPNDPGEWRNEACRRLVRNLTEAEWRLYVGGDIAYEKTCPGTPSAGT